MRPGGSACSYGNGATFGCPPLSVTCYVPDAVLGNKLVREVAEQVRIDQLGGIGNLLNKVNPIGPARQALMDSLTGH